MPLVKKNVIRKFFKLPFLHRIWQLSILNFREHATYLRSPKNLSNLLILLISYLHFVRTFIALFNSIYTWIWYVCKKLGKEPVRSQMTHYRFTNFCCLHKIFKFFLNLDEEENLLNLEQSRKFISCWKVCLHLYLNHSKLGQNLLPHFLSQHIWISLASKSVVSSLTFCPNTYSLIFASKFVASFFVPTYMNFFCVKICCL